MWLWKLSKVIAWNKANNRIKSPLHDLLSSVGEWAMEFSLLYYESLCEVVGVVGKGSLKRIVLGLASSQRGEIWIGCYAGIYGLRAILFGIAMENNQNIRCFENVSMKIFKWKRRENIPPWRTSSLLISSIIRCFPSSTRLPSVSSNLWKAINMLIWRYSVRWRYASPKWRSFLLRNPSR